MFKNYRLMFASLFAALLFAPSAFSQDHTRSWDNGTVWTVNYVQTNPGMFNAYINDLSQVWRRYLEAQKKDGDVVSYKMLSVAFARDDEPNLILLVEFANWKAFDRSNEYFENMAKELQGSVDKARLSNINREELRSLRGSLVAQEIVYQD